MSFQCNSSVSLHLHLFNSLLNSFNVKDLLNNNIKLLLKDLTENRTMRKCSVFNLKVILIILNVDVLNSDKKELSKELVNNDITIEKSFRYFLHFFKNRFYLTDLILNLVLNLIFNLSTILSFSFAVAAVCFFITNAEIMHFLSLVFILKSRLIFVRMKAEIFISIAVIIII